MLPMLLVNSCRLQAAMRFMSVIVCKSRIITGTERIPPQYRCAMHDAATPLDIEYKGGRGFPSGKSLVANMTVGHLRYPMESVLNISALINGSVLQKGLETSSPFDREDYFKSVYRPCIMDDEFMLMPIGVILDG